MNALQREIEQAVISAIRSTLPQITPATPDAKSWNIQQCAEYLQVSESLLRQMVANKQIPHFRMGKRIQFHPHKVREWEGTGEEVVELVGRGEVKRGRKPGSAKQSKTVSI